ncbi:helix-turn-helix transcriptional regulator [Amycolatopsis rhabdoformis]|uniref:Helix-turn-helix transcriptional regulator n=1 Tax=Amycolatopsis rhabdoformis TaxID=1448059 RepID=A0ABZ1HW02_9PSEU|nr:helix-turn-helix transcriptional regulator [Amycolatopsis rhabdoformis]WSE26429.1 helix-turn-helix transcriptional regulator [Amycolatopsis rhabdoformis]
MLSEIELQVADLAAHGTSVRAIAELLGVSTNAVTEHLTAVYRKLGP